MALRIGLVGMRGIGNTHAQAYTKDPLAKLTAGGKILTVAQPLQVCSLQ